MDLEKLSKDVEYCKESFKKESELLSRLAVVETDVKYIVKLLGAPHICKWNGKIGELWEFKVQTDPIRNDIFRRLDLHSEKINSLEDTLIALNKGKQLLEEIKENQEAEMKKKADRRIRLRDAILLLAVGGIITLIGGLLLDFLKPMV